MFWRTKQYRSLLILLASLVVLLAVSFASPIVFVHAASADDRQQVTPAVGKIGLLSSTFTGYDPESCTAFAIGAHDLATAAHCVTKVKADFQLNIATGGSFSPGYDGSGAPANPCTVTKVEPNPGWAAFWATSHVHGSTDTDYAHLTVDCDLTATGIFSFISSAPKVGDASTLYGYPQDKTGQWGDIGSISSVTEKMIETSNYGIGGQSGAPMYNDTGVFAIHTWGPYAGGAPSWGVRITCAVKQFFLPLTACNGDQSADNGSALDDLPVRITSCKPVTIDLLRGPASADTATITDITNGRNGTAQISANNRSITYTPKKDGLDSFDYTIFSPTGDIYDLNLNGVTGVETVGTQQVVVSGCTLASLSPFGLTLSWSDYRDLDLSIVDPAHEEIYYGHRTSRSGGALDQDANAGCSDETNTPIEHITWTGAPPEGTYVITVNDYDDCGVAGASNFTLTATAAGQQISVYHDVLASGSKSFTIQLSQTTAVYGTCTTDACKAAPSTLRTDMGIAPTSPTDAETIALGNLQSYVSSKPAGSISCVVFAETTVQLNASIVTIYSACNDGN